MQRNHSKTGILLIVASMLAGCAASEEDEDQQTLSQNAPGLSELPTMSDAGLDAGPSLPPLADHDAGADGGAASGAIFVSVKSNGTGCPRGTTSTSVSADGTKFNTTFSAFEAIVSENQTIAVKDCQLAIKLNSPSGFSYGVSELYFEGYAYLEKGQKARIVAKSYFQGAPVQSEEARVELVGPFDDTFSFHDVVRTTDLVWSPCGVARDLNLRMTLRLMNSGRRDGYINMEHAPRVKLMWRRC